MNSLHRRQFLSLGAAVVAGRVLSACSSSSNGITSDGSDAGATLDAGGADAGALDAADAATIPWATGGTASMTGTYPNPFAGGVTVTTCAATCELTEGPCYSAQSVEIQDISYGYPGLPVRMYFQILDESCKPIAGAVIDTWHVSPVGKYSGDDTVNEDIAFCTGNDSDFTSKLYFRGKQTTDANGVCYFDTCYPGWYSSRTIHVHLTISVNGSAYVTTQLCFDDALDNDIVASQPLYDTRGARDTTNTSDTVFNSSDYTDYEFQTQKMSDGVMLAWKTIILRSSLTESICSPSGGSGTGGGGGDGGMGGTGMGGPGGEGGPPPGFEGGAPPGFDAG